MAAPTLSESPGSAAPTECAAGPLYRLSLGQYREMGRLGVLTRRDRVVLRDGLLVAKMTKGSRHVAATKLLVRALGCVVPAGWHVAKEDPIALPDGPGGRDSMPEPDLTVLRGAIRDYLTQPPGPSDVALVAEVADSSLREDRQGLVLYARAGIPVAWLVNLAEGTVEVHSDPGEGPKYRDCRVFGAGDSIPVALGGQVWGVVAVRDVLP